VGALASAMRRTASTGAGMSGFFARDGATSWLRICATSFSASLSRSLRHSARAVYARAAAVAPAASAFSASSSVNPSSLAR
jgi:hypothetical protein